MALSVSIVDEGEDSAELCGGRKLILTECMFDNGSMMSGYAVVDKRTRIDRS